MAGFGRGGIALIPVAWSLAACGGGAPPAERAQEWFLQNGCPGRDRRGLDPDGDGSACGRDPARARAAAAAARN